MSQRDAPESIPDRARFAALAASFLREPALDEELHARREALELRRSRLEAAQPPITEADYLGILHGRLGDCYALRVVRHWIARTQGVVRSVPGGQGGKPMRFLVLAGERGRGKTVAAMWAVANYGGYFVGAPDLRELATSNGLNDRERILQLHRSKLLVIDDLGTEAMDARTVEIMNRLINARQVGKTHTILTTNLDKAALFARYGDRVFERVLHQGKIVPVHGDNMRDTG